MLPLGGLSGGDVARARRGGTRPRDRRGSRPLKTLATLTATHSGPGRVGWIGLRPGRLAPLETPAEAMLEIGGLAGDHARPGKRALTLIQQEHLAVIGALTGKGEAIAPERLRRNFVISGINLTALRGRRIAIGSAVVEITIPCAPCSRMEEELGTGGYNAMRGHGGWCASIVTPGRIALGDTVHVVEDTAS